MTPIIIPQNKEQFDQQISHTRQLIKQSLNKKDQHLMVHLPDNEGQLYRRMNSSCPVLWVAPHGFFGDAVHSDYIGIFAAQLMAGSCLINNKHCRCPIPEPGYGEIANLNDPDDPGPHAKVFINKLKSAISIIRLKSGQIPFIVILLNQPDADANSFEFSVVTSNEPHDSPDAKWVLALKQSIVSTSFTVNFLEQHIQTYDRTLLSYLYCNQSESGPVRLIQIRFNCHLLTDRSIVPISGFLSRALTYASQSCSNKNQLCFLKQSVEELIETEEEPDLHLVEEAGMKLTEIISRHYENAMIEAGNYIVKTFFANDIERARSKQAAKDKSLHQLILYLQNQKNNAPSKTWLYNAVNLAVDSSDYKNSHIYAKLMLSHKIELLPISHHGLKKHLIKEIVDKKLTVSQLKDRISQVKQLPYDKLFPDSKTKNHHKPNKKHIPRLLKKNEKKGEMQSKKILSCLNDPEKLIKDNINQLFTQESLSNMSSGKRRQIFRKLEKKHTEILAYIQELKLKILVNEKYLQQYQNLMVELEKSINN
jgi:hypothetical protein